MRLSRKKAIKLCIEVWSWCAETGRIKKNWPRWKDFMTKKEAYDCHYCWFCLYDSKKGNSCKNCPLTEIYGHCNILTGGCEFYYWNRATTISARKKYAKLFLGQIRSIK